MTFYNTIKLSGEDLLQKQSSCNRQQKLILRTMEQERNQRRLDSDFNEEEYQGMTPADVWQSLGQLTCPLTSVRARMTTLTKEGLLVKTEHKKMGVYRTDNYTWKLNY